MTSGSSARPAWVGQSRARHWSSSRNSTSDIGKENHSEENEFLLWKRFWKLSPEKSSFVSTSNSSAIHGQGWRSNFCSFLAIMIIWIKRFFLHPWRSEEHTSE